MAKVLLCYFSPTFTSTPCIHKAVRAATMSSSALSAPMTLVGKSKSKTPKLVYGTAWKKESTAALVYQAIRAGFRGIDTAAQPKHYQEHLVGDGIRRAISDGIVKREELFIQTKYTPVSGQDPQNLPYDPSSSVEDQVHASIASSLKNLSTTSSPADTYIDSVLLHSPLPTIAETLLAWNVLSTYVSAGKILNLGIANVSSKVLSALLTANVSQRPSVVQNRFYPQTQFEVSLRNLCRRHGIIFQSFWTLTGNLGEGQLMQSEVVRRLADDISVSRAVALYALVIGLDGVSVLDGTTNEGHMAEDIDGLKMIEEWAGGNGKDKWEVLTAQFRVLINDI